MARKILAVILGIVAAFLVVMAMEMVGHAIWPPPKGVNHKDSAQVAVMMASMPAMALQWLLLGWALALLSGAVVARWIAKSPARWVWLTVAVLFIAATVANLFMLPHPQWFNIEVAVVFAALLGLLAVRFRQTTTAR